MADFYNRTVKEVANELSVDLAVGLSVREVEKRRAKYGANELKMAGTPLWKKLLAPFMDIFMLILIVALVLSAVQQDWLEAIVIAVIIAADAIVYYVQRFSTERILRSLNNTIVQNVVVLREGVEQSVEAADLVLGDIVILQEGDRVPADGRIVNESGLLTNESMLTGESEPIAKDAKTITGQKKVYEQRNMVFSGSFVFTGKGRFIVTATSNATEYGRIASLATAATSVSPISQKIDKLVLKIAAVVVGLAAVALILQLVDGIEWLGALKFTLAMIVSAVPEGLPIAISIVLALCAKRMARKQALIKELKAIESIGIVTTIASDKTGTLTKNQLEMQETWTRESEASFLKALAGATLVETVTTTRETQPADPLDTCMAQFLRERDYDLEALDPRKVYAFDQNIKMSGNLYDGKAGEYVLMVKGAPETILARAKMAQSAREQVEVKLVELANKGYKVLALAHGQLKHEINELERLSKHDELKFDGLIAVADGIRPETAAAIRQAKRMGVKTKMVTGDHAGTAYAIGRELGLAEDFAQVLDCSKLGNITDDDLENVVKNTTVFARVTPEDKYRVLEAIKKTEICAMTGDGVNDVPALVSAHVGIAMGDAPSIVQDAGDIVLIDNNFKNITEAIRESRTVLGNIRRMLGYLLATNAGEALTMLGALIFTGGQLLTPIQILWINLVTDSLLVVPLGLEPPEQKILRQRPEAKDAPILSSAMIRRMALTAFLMAALTLATYYVALAVLNDPAQANTLAFTALVVMQWSNALTTRGTYESVFQRLKVRHPAFYWALGGAVVLQIAAVFGPLARAIGVVAAPLGWVLGVTVVAFVIPMLAIEAYKWMTNR